jgi:hypothetical protein
MLRNACYIAYNVVGTHSIGKAETQGKRGGNLFVRVQRKRCADGSEALYASVVENRRVKGRVVQRTVVNIGRVEADQVPYLKAAWTDADRRPRLVWD